MTVSLEQAQLSLSELITRSAHDEKVIITQNHKPVTELHSLAETSAVPVFGSCKAAGYAGGLWWLSRPIVEVCV